MRERRAAAGARGSTARPIRSFAGCSRSASAFRSTAGEHQPAGIPARVPAGLRRRLRERVRCRAQECRALRERRSIPHRLAGRQRAVPEALKPSSSQIVLIRDLAYHVRTWGEADAPKLFMLHGWMDVGASFQFLVDALQRDWYVIAPDWRGFGKSAWCADGYWFADYIADLEALLDAFAPHERCTSRRTQPRRQRRHALRRHPAGARREGRFARRLRHSSGRRIRTHRENTRSGSMRCAIRRRSLRTRASRRSPIACRRAIPGSRATRPSFSPRIGRRCCPTAARDSYRIRATSCHSRSCTGWRKCGRSGRASQRPVLWVGRERFVHPEVAR